MKARVAGIWRGRTREALANEYLKYLYEEGVKKLRATKDNLGSSTSGINNYDPGPELPTPR